MRIGLKETTPGRAFADRKGRKILLSAALFVMIIGGVLCLRTGKAQFLSPLETAENLWLALRLFVAKLFRLPFYLEKQKLIAAYPFYMETMARLRMTALYFLSGMILSLAGSVYQGVFRNPMAAPTMLGVASGINLGLLILALQFAVDAYGMVTQRYIYCFGLSLLILALVLLGAKMVGRNRTSVTDMLLIGILLSQMVNTVVMYYRFQMDDIQLEVYQQLTMRGMIFNTSESDAVRGVLLLLIVTAVGALPVYLMRFCFNAISFSEEEARSMGVDPRKVRVVAITGVTMLVAAAIIHCGNVGILSLVVPHICRYYFGARFKTLLYSSAFYGGLALVLCSGISGLIYIEDYGTLPLGPIVSLLAMPILAVALTRRRRGWE